MKGDSQETKMEKLKEEVARLKSVSVEFKNTIKELKMAFNEQIKTNKSTIKDLTLLCKEKDKEIVKLIKQTRQPHVLRSLDKPKVARGGVDGIDPPPGYSDADLD